jgi:hypothetical protein
MQDNIYAVPESSLHTESEAPVVQEFYVVSKLKFFLLFFCTMGLYGFYWNYRSWKQYKIANNEDMWPVARAIFSIFFTHSLYGIIDMRAVEKDSSYKWSPNLWATLVVVSIIADNISGRVGGNEALVNSFIFFNLIARGLFVFQAQKVANIACGDPDGISNSHFSPLNFLWIFMFPIIFVVAVIAAILFAG